MQWRGEEVDGMIDETDDDGGLVLMIGNKLQALQH